MTDPKLSPALAEGVREQPKEETNTRPMDTPLQAAIRTAFDNPTRANIEAVAALAEAAVPQRENELVAFVQRLAAAQQPLPPEFAKVLHDNYWSLLVDTPAEAAVPPRGEQAIPDHICGVCYHPFDRCSYCG